MRACADTSARANPGQKQRVHAWTNMQLANDASENTIKIAKPHPNASDEQASEFHSVDVLSAHFAVQKHLPGLGVEAAATTNAPKHRPPTIV